MTFKWCAELLMVDNLVLAIGLLVAIKTRLDILIPVNLHLGRALGLCGSQKGAAATHTIDVTMRIDQRVEAIFRAPTADSIDDFLAAR